MCCPDGQKSIGHDRAGTTHFFRLSDPPAIRVPFSGVSHSRKGTVTRTLPEQPVMNGSVTVCMLPYPRFFPPFRLSTMFFLSVFSCIHAKNVRSLPERAVW